MVALVQHDTFFRAVSPGEDRWELAVGTIAEEVWKLLQGNKL